MDDGRCERLGDLLGEEARHVVDVGELARLIDLPEVREAANLAFEVAAGSPERGERGGRHIGGVDLGERVDEVEPERVSRVRCFEPWWELLGDHVPVEVAHDVERDADHALVVADRDDVGEAREPGGADRLLEPSLAHHVVSRGRQRRPRRAAEHEALAAALDQEGEVRPTAVPDPSSGDRPRTELVLVQKRLDVLFDDQRRQHEPMLRGAVAVRAVSGGQTTETGLARPVLRDVVASVTRPRS